MRPICYQPPVQTGGLKCRHVGAFHVTGVFARWEHPGRLDRIRLYDAKWTAVSVDGNAGLANGEKTSVGAETIPMERPEQRQAVWELWVASGAAIAALTVVLAALRDHLLRSWLSVPETRLFDLALQYQFYHSLGLIVCGLAARLLPSRAMHLVGVLLLLGIVGFSGGLYLKIVVPNLTIGWMIPAGAALWVVGWLLFAIVAVVRRGETST